MENTEDENIDIIKENAGSIHSCKVNFKKKITWHGREFTIIACACNYYESGLCFCPGICKGCQERKIDVHDPKHHHPRNFIGFHPMYPVALARLAMVDYSDAPWSSYFHVAPIGVPVRPETSGNDSSKEGEMCIARARTEIFDNLGDFGNLSAAQRISKLQETFQGVQKIAAKTTRDTKVACAYLVELENRLKNQTPYKASVSIRTTAVDSACSRYSTQMLKNHAKKPKKRKANSDFESEPCRKRKRMGCKTCRDVFKEKKSIYLGHRSTSTKCPNRDRRVEKIVYRSKVSTMNEDEYKMALNNLAAAHFPLGVSYPEFSTNIRRKTTENDLVPEEMDDNYTQMIPIYRKFIRDQRKMHKPPSSNHFLTSDEEDKDKDNESECNDSDKSRFLV